MFHDTVLLYDTKGTNCAEKLFGPLRKALEKINRTVESTLSTSWVLAWYNLTERLSVIEKISTMHLNFCFDEPLKTQRH